MMDLRVGYEDAHLKEFVLWNTGKRAQKIDG